MSLTSSIRRWIGGEPADEKTAAEATQDKPVGEEATAEGMPETSDDGAIPGYKRVPPA